MENCLSRFLGGVCAFFLRLAGLQVGRGFSTERCPFLKIRGAAANIEIGRYVVAARGLDLRNRENGRIQIHDYVRFDRDVRLVAARDGLIQIGEHSAIGPFTIINGGGSVILGKNVLLARGVSINANDHLHDRGKTIRGQGFTYADVIIEDDVWLGANVCVNKGVTIRKGSIVGANAVVTSSTEPFSINVGVPARKIGERE